MALRTLIWGCGAVYKEYYNLINYQILKGCIDIIGITGREEEYESIDGFKFLHQKDLPKEKIDAVIMAVGQNLQGEIREKIAQMNICVDNILPVNMLKIPGMDIEKYFVIKNSRLSIIASSCWGGIVYHYLGLPFLSPFINVSIDEADFLKLMSDFKSYMEMEPEFQGWRSNIQEGKVFPYFNLGDITILFPHDDDPDVVLANWNRRKERINYDNLFFMMGTREKENLRKFEMQPPIHKCCFTSFPTDSSVGCYLSMASYALRQSVEGIAHFVLLGNVHGYNLFDILVD